MRRRSSAGGETAKTRRSKTVTLKRRNAPKAVRAHSSSATGQETEVAELRRERDEALEQLSEALEQQTATSNVLRVISSSPGELEPVFKAMLENATRVCGASFGVLFRYEGGLFHPAASLDVPPAFADFLGREGSFAPKPGQLFGRLCQSKTVIHVVDRATEPNPSPSFRYAGARSSIAVEVFPDHEPGLLSPSPIRLFHIANDGLSTIVHMDVLDATKLLSAVTQASKQLYLHRKCLH
ncbi:MAG: hypothetical protein WBE50_07715 [Methyloceanibacter sp.]